MNILTLNGIDDELPLTSIWYSRHNGWWSTELPQGARVLPSQYITAHKNRVSLPQLFKSRLNPAQSSEKRITMLSTPQLATSKNFLGLASRQLPKVAATTPARGFSTTLSSEKQKDITLLQDKANGFGFARSNPRPAKPRSTGVTEIRGPYYSVCQPTYLTVEH